MKQFDWLGCWTVAANLATSMHFLFLSPLHPESQASNKLLSLVEQSFLYISNQNCYLFCDWLTRSSLTSFIFLRRRCLLTDFMVQFDHFSPGAIQPLNSGDQPKKDARSSTCLNMAKVLLSGLVFFLSSPWVFTLTMIMQVMDNAEVTRIVRQDHCALPQKWPTTCHVHFLQVLCGTGNM